MRKENVIRVIREKAAIYAARQAQILPIDDQGYVLAEYARWQAERYLANTLGTYFGAVDPVFVASDEFDSLFSTVTGYHELDKRIAKTKAHKDKLLLVLRYPELPLHNNPAELAARQRVRKRDISFGPPTDDGLKAWDTFMTLSETAKKLGVNFYSYLHDRVTGSFSLPSLASLIRARLAGESQVFVSD